MSLTYKTLFIFTPTKRHMAGRSAYSAPNYDQRLFRK